MFKFFKTITLFSILIFAAAGFVTADEIKFDASIDKQSVAIGETAQLGLTFYGTHNVPAPDIGNIDGVEVRYLGPSTTMTVINGVVSNSITHMYRVQPLRLGKFQLGPFTFKYEGNAYRSNPIFLTASEEKPKEEKKADEGEESIVDSLDLKDRIFLTLKIDKNNAYINELIPVVIKLYVNRLNVSDIQLPVFDQEGFSKAQFEEPKQYRERMGGLLYDVLEFKTTIFGTRPGEYKLGAARLKCSLALRKRVKNISPFDDDFLNQRGVRDPYFEDFFTRYERYPIELKSEEAQLVLSPLPAEGKPVDFSGAIGDYQFMFQAGPKNVKVGDPVTLKMEISGTGNLNTVIIPKLENTEGFRVYEPQIKTEPNKKVFRQVLIPENELIHETPKAVFTYFNPDKKIYKTIVPNPVPLQVEKVSDAPAQVIGATQITAPSMLGPAPESKNEPHGDILYIKESIGRVQGRDFRIYNTLPYQALLLAPFMLLVSFYIFYARKDKLLHDTRYAHRTAAFKDMKKEFLALKHHLKTGDSRLFYETLFKALQSYLGGRLYLPVAGLTFDNVESTLKEKNVDIVTINKVKNIFDVCDRAKFALFRVDEFRMKDDMKELEEIIHNLERMKSGEGK